jgi:hypothetical protein
MLNQCVLGFPIVCYTLLSWTLRLHNVYEGHEATPGFGRPARGPWFSVRICNVRVRRKAICRSSVDLQNYKLHLRQLRLSFFCRDSLSLDRQTYTIKRPPQVYHDAISTMVDPIQHHLNATLHEIAKKCIDLVAASSHIRPSSGCAPIATELYQCVNSRMLFLHVVDPQPRC